MVICHMLSVICHCHSLPFALVKSRLVLPCWYRLTRVVQDKGPLNVCVCVCVCHRMKSMQCTYRIQTFPAHLCFSNKAINKLSQYDTKINNVKCNEKLRKGSRRTVKSNVKYTDIAVCSLTCCAPLLQCLGRLSLPLFVGR